MKWRFERIPIKQKHSTLAVVESNVFPNRYVYSGAEFKKYWLIVMADAKRNREPRIQINT